MVWMTCTQDGREHAVADEQVSAGAPIGRYQAQCGRFITPGSLAAPPGRRCLTCHATVTPRAVLPRPTPSCWRALRIGRNVGT
jgi:hypothetical protein